MPALHHLAGMRYEDGLHRQRGVLVGISFSGVSTCKSPWMSLPVVLLLAAGMCAPHGSALALEAIAEDPLTRPAGLEPDINFWRKIFGEVSTNQALIHDNRYLGIVYEKLDLSGYSGDVARQQAMDAAKAKYVGILARLADGSRVGLGKDERLGRRCLQRFS